MRCPRCSREATEFYLGELPHTSTWPSPWTNFTIFQYTGRNTWFVGIVRCKKHRFKNSFH